VDEERQAQFEPAFFYCWSGSRRKIMALTGIHTLKSWQLPIGSWENVKA
jgi:hypothetical protein